MNRPLCCDDLCKIRPWCGMKHWFTPAKLGKGGWRIVQCADTKSVFIVEIKRAKLGFADAGRILQHGLEYRLQGARRAGNDAQHLRRCRLLLQRFAEVVR